MAAHLIAVARHISRIGAAIALATLTACVAATPANTFHAERQADAPNAGVAEFFELVRWIRLDAGCPDLEEFPPASAVAYAHSEDMRQRGYFAHESPEGHGVIDRLRAAGITFTAAAENLAHGARYGAEALKAWLDSPGHRANLLNCTFTRQGVGVAGPYWTHLLLSP